MENQADSRVSNRQSNGFRSIAGQEIRYSAPNATFELKKLKIAALGSIFIHSKSSIIHLEMVAEQQIKISPFYHKFKRHNFALAYSYHSSATHALVLPSL
jgi:hypothetical protein